MDVKSAFLNGPIKEEIYVEQSPSFENSEFLDHIFRLKKIQVYLDHQSLMKKDDAVCSRLKLGGDDS
ncbi:unnamed protein product [Spirodela intermedia]|uniref:Uncharacterized protein n=1 Tax=Spirodela intermedia TaxID=51605 RepID=A0A7I8JME4_SPIIN|nr:unnamed protein product [Spirodela intermedia]CAA6670642.1 unnamed protein product [Spirodela intermedia]